MKLHTALLTVVGLTVTVPADAADPTTSGALGVPANRIVGLWSTQGAVGPCGSNTFPIQVRNTLLFQAGGTVVEAPQFPPQGIQIPGVGLSQRGVALGTWSYDPVTQRYSAHFQFDTFLDNVYSGYATVDREMQLSNDGQQVAGPVLSTRYASNGSVISELCGTSVSTRL